VPAALLTVSRVMISPFTMAAMLAELV